MIVFGDKVNDLYLNLYFITINHNFDYCLYGCENLSPIVLEEHKIEFLREEYANEYTLK